MKPLIFTAILCAAATGVFAQNGADSTKTKKDTLTHIGGHRSTVSFRFNTKRDRTGGLRSDSTKAKKFKPGITWGLTFSRFDLGLTTLIDNGSTRLSPTNEFLRYRSWKSSNVGFDLFQLGYRFSPHFKIYGSAGFDWTLIRLRENITILPDQPTLTYKQETIKFSKNRLSSSYLRVPLTFDFRTNEDADGERYHFTTGLETGFLLGGRVKQKSNENGKQKIDDDYHFTKFRYGGFIRAAHGSIGIFAKYYVNDMFDTPAQKGLKNFAFGFTLGI